MNSLLVTAALISIVAAQHGKFTQHARAIIFKSKSGDFPDGVVGVIDFYQENDGVRLNGSISGLTTGLHGFHVHEKGDLSNGCLASGGHYNPFHKHHGAPHAKDRHNGDLGNIETTGSGSTEVQMSDSYLALNGPFSILGRAVVVHEKADDLGLGGTEASRTTGDAGGRVACGVIGIA